MPHPSDLKHGRSIRTKLLIVIGVVNLFAAIASGTVWILNTRAATRAEVEASLEVAQGLSRAIIVDLASKGHVDQLSERLPEGLRNLRHVRLLLMVDGKLTKVSPPVENSEQQPRRAPTWFAALVVPEMEGDLVRDISVSPDVPVFVIGEPADEIAEAWHDFAALAIIWLTLNCLVIVILYVVLGRVLDPLASLARGMQRLRGGRYATRLGPSKVKEISDITGRFNGLAGKLESARDENSQLYRELITRQEQVRSEIAHELHDEAGACLFGIAANASSIKSLAGQVEDEHGADIGSRVGQILSDADRLKAMNRAILKQLRPGAIGQVALSQLIEELVSGLQRNHQATQILATVEGLAKSYGESTDLTLYRCIQEGTAAAIQKGNASTIYIDVAEVVGRKIKNGGNQDGGKMLRAKLRFDGTQLSASTPKDLTIATMTERVRAVGGTCVVRNSKTRGTSIRIDMPIKRAAAPKAEVELVGGIQ